jgi:hypothetical protein
MSHLKKGIEVYFFSPSVPPGQLQAEVYLFYYPFRFQLLLNAPPGLTLLNSTFFPQNVFMCFVKISEKTAIISWDCVG